jgi:DNA-directed RNA polymerase subunit M/transcription elongation factor TFIIS
VEAREPKTLPARQKPGTLLNYMSAFGPAAESLRLGERYHALTDDELLAIAEDSSDLTDLAQQALAAELSQRRLQLPPKPTAPRPLPEATRQADAADDYAEDRQIVGIATVWSLRDGLQLQKLLDQAEVPFFMGREKAARAEAVTSNFRDGVAVGVMQIGLPWAQEALKHYEPADEPATEDEQGGEDLAVHCPSCHSEDVIFEHLAEVCDSKEGEKFAWTCASCGHHWEDDGLETKN